MFLAQAIGRLNFTEPLQIGVVSNHTQQVTQGDECCPEKATLLGPCKVIPQEYPNVYCRSIDIALPAAGTSAIEELRKSTVANALERTLFDSGRQVIVIDGDNLRHGLRADLGFSEEDRVENIRRVGEVAVLLARAELIVITAFISPYRAGRDAVRAKAAGGCLVEVYVNAPIEVCEARDVKGSTRKRAAGRFRGSPGSRRRTSRRCHRSWS
jgi:adenylyl-sulfate kinase